jgi:hypothetical protein
MADLIDPAAAAFAANHTTPFAGPLAAVAGWTAGNTVYPQMMAGRDRSSPFRRSPGRRQD